MMARRKSRQGFANPRPNLAQRTNRDPSAWWITPGNAYRFFMEMAKFKVLFRPCIISWFLSSEIAEPALITMIDQPRKWEGKLGSSLKAPMSWLFCVHRLIALRQLNIPGHVTHKYHGKFSITFSLCHARLGARWTSHAAREASCYRGWSLLNYISRIARGTCSWYYSILDVRI